MASVVYGAVSASRFARGSAIVCTVARPSFLSPGVSRSSTNTISANRAAILYSKRLKSTNPPGSSNAAKVDSAAAPTFAGTGAQRRAESELYQRTRDRGPVSWPSLFLVGVAALSAVSYYRIERERRLEEAMGKIVSSESDQGWTPRPDYLAKRTFVKTNAGWFPRDDGFGARECLYRSVFGLESWCGC